MPNKRTIQSNPYLAKNARCRFQWLITKGLAGRGFKNGCLTPNGYTLTSVLVTAVLIGIIAVPLIKISMQVGVTQQRSLNREKARFKALSIAQVGKKSNDISKVEALASEKDCTVEGADGVYLATCTVGFTKQSLGTGSKAFVMCEDNQLSELMKKVKPGREIYKGENNYYTLVYLDHPRMHNPALPGNPWFSWGSANQNSYRSDLRDEATNLGGDIATLTNQQLFDYWKTSFGDEVSFGAYIYLDSGELGVANFEKMTVDKWWTIPDYQAWSTGDRYSGYGPEYAVVEIPHNSSSNENDAQNCEG